MSTDFVGARARGFQSCGVEQTISYSNFPELRERVNALRWRT
jgi:hypothetical protein